MLFSAMSDKAIFEQIKTGLWPFSHKSLFLYEGLPYKAGGSIRLWVVLFKYYVKVRGEGSSGGAMINGPERHEFDFRHFNSFKPAHY